MTLQLFFDQCEIVLDLLNRNQLISKDLGGGIDNITEDDCSKMSIMSRPHPSASTALEYTVKEWPSCGNDQLST